MCHVGRLHLPTFEKSPNTYLPTFWCCAYLLSRFEQRARTSILSILTAVYTATSALGQFPRIQFFESSTKKFFFSKPMFPSALPAQCCQGDGFYPKGKGVTSSLVRGSRSRLSSLVTIILHCTHALEGMFVKYFKHILIWIF